MTEIRIHGRGGQGNLVAAYVLAQAAFEFGNFAQAFPSFSPQRRGAPVTALVHMTHASLHSDWNASQPAFVILQDHALMHTAGVMEGLAPQGRILVNWSKPIAPTTLSNGYQVVVMPAAKLGMEYLGKPLPNTALLAALIALTGMLPLRALEQALAARFDGEILERNLALVRKAVHMVPAGLWKESAAAQLH